MSLAQHHFQNQTVQRLRYQIGFYLLFAVGFASQYATGWIGLFEFTLFEIVCLGWLAVHLYHYWHTHGRPIVTIDREVATFVWIDRSGHGIGIPRTETFPLDQITSFRVEPRWWGLTETYVIEVARDERTLEIEVLSTAIAPTRRQALCDLLDQWASR